MNFSKYKYSILFLIPITVIAFTISFYFDDKKSKKEIVILHTNDIESVYDPIPAIWRSDMEKIGGISHLATLIRNIRNDERISFLVDAGDIYTGALSKKSEGKLPFDLYSAINYDAMNIGNHEFEYGWESLVETIPRASFPVLNANIINEYTGELIAQPYTILEKEGVKIGVIGIMGIDAFFNTTASFQRVGLTIKDPTETAQYWADKIRDQVNMIIILTHQNRTAPMQTNKESDPSVQRGFHEDYEMAGNLRGVDAIYGGHSDNGLVKPVIHPDTGVIIGLTFGQGMHLGYTKFIVDTRNHNVSFIDGYLIPVNSNELPKDKLTDKLIGDYRKLYPELSEVISTSSKPLMRSYNRESTIGNLLTDYMREAAKSDIAFLNSGAIRSDLYPGNITLEKLINVYPFKDNLTTISLTGMQVKKLVEYSLTLPYGIGQISGLEIKYDSTLDKMKRLVSIKVNGNEIIDSKEYTVSTSGYLSKGGDGYSIFTEGQFVDDSISFQDALYISFKNSKKVEVPALERQIDISKRK